MGEGYAASGSNRREPVKMVPTRQSYFYKRDLKFMG
jgi:hypothetical protein